MSFSYNGYFAYPPARIAACGDSQGETHSAWRIAPAGGRRPYHVLVSSELAWTPRAGERTEVRMSRTAAIAAVHAAHESDCSSDPAGSEDFWVA